MQYRDSRQEVTGLVVNSKVNVRREYRHAVRAMVYRLFTTGSFDFEYTSIDALGAKVKSKAPGKLGELHGMLGFIDGVDLFNKSIAPKKKKKREEKCDSSKELMYKRFLLFKEFYTASNPVLICEGKTDNVYITHAIRSLAARYPMLAAVDPEGKISIKIRRFRYTDRSTGRILGIGGGSGDLCGFLKTYKEELRRFRAPGMFYPVVVLIDNDDGASSIYSTIKQLTGIQPSGGEPFIHVVGNLYVVPTPLLGKKPSAIEDFFEPTTRSVLLNGRSFSPSNNFDPRLYYGKSEFAYKVVQPDADKINFDGF